MTSGDNVENDTISPLASDIDKKSGRARLRVLADICKEDTTAKYPKQISCSDNYIYWVTKVLPGKLHGIYNKRNLAEHDTEATWDRNELGEYYKQYLGLGQYGIIPKLCKVLIHL